MIEKTPRKCKYGGILIVSNPFPTMIELDTAYVPCDLWCCNEKVWVGWITSEGGKEFCKDCELFEPLIREVR